LVIDPYRDECKSETVISGRITMEQPFLATGFDDAPGEVREALAESLKATGCGYVGAIDIGGGVPWLQVLGAGAAKGDEAAAAVVVNIGEKFQPVELEPAGDGQLLGLAVRTPALEETIPYALEAGFDLLILDGSGGFATAWPEVSGHPDLTVLRQAITVLRRLNREEDIALIYFGGIRSGTDAAKCLALGFNAVMVGVAMGLGLGGNIENGTMVFTGDRTLEERITAGTRLIQGMADETSILARCTGKTNIHNLEPEDLKAITLPTAKATGIPMVGRAKN
ncbi:MAG: alpha-hydroxy-acid oxidizing protein, partial [Rhodospirillales bacterium]